MPSAKPAAGDNHVRALMRLAPYLWPKGEVELRIRVVAALLLLAAAKAANAASAPACSSAPSAPWP